MSEALARFLRQHFLDRKDRYLCFTSHWPLTMEAGNVSPRSLIVVTVPISTDLSLYNSVIPSHVTPSQIAFYSGVVGSICAVMGPERHIPQTKFVEWFRQHRKEEWVVKLSSSDPTLMAAFLNEIFLGQPRNITLREFDRFALHKLVVQGTLPLFAVKACSTIYFSY